MASHPDLAAEQEHIDRAYRRLDAMREAAADSLQAALAHGKGGTNMQALVERDVLVANSVQRMGRLEIGGEALCFGRIDRETSEAFHIGRLAIADEDHEPLVIDWRAPAAEPFYRATGRHPLGLRRRRHFLTDHRRLVGIEDEIFDGEGGGNDLGLAGSGALIAALERSRTGRRRDSGATVQREQDEIIRAPLAGVLVVQGGPGTGKTAVALHRAAYLLYTHRFPLERQGVLVIGPNRLFMRYIEQVLPSLGESGVEMSTIAGLVQRVDATEPEPAAVSRLKGDVRMARVLARAVKDRERPLREDLEVGLGAYVLRLTTAASADIVNTARRRAGPHNQRRGLVERLFFQALHQQYLRAADRNRRAGLRPPPPGADDEGNEIPAPEELSAADLAREVRRQPDVVAALERMWPVLRPEELLRDLFGAAPLIALAGRGVLTPDEEKLLRRPRGEHAGDVRWSAGDAALLDEARALLGPGRRRSGADTEQPEEEARTFGHIVVDEAQDLTPMQLRMLNRRSLSGSMTLVGDVAQATGQWAPNAWDDVLQHLPTRRGTKVVELSVNYRTPSEIMDIAARVLAVALPGARPPESVRSSEHVPRTIAANDGGLAGAVAAAASEELRAVGDGRVAIICTTSLREELAAGLTGAGVAFGEPARQGLDAPITLVPVEVVKGLEFDAVVVVEPAAIAREAAQGLQALYVALTRATQRLTLVHAEPLPSILQLD